MFMNNPALCIAIGALGYSVMARIYRAVFDPTTKHVTILARENDVLKRASQSLRMDNASLREILVAHNIALPDPPAFPVEEEIRSLIAQNRKIEAIKLLRQTSGLGLKEAKDSVDAMAAGVPPLLSSPSAATDMSSGDRIANLVRAGNKIAAIRDYRAATGASLVDAKAYIEELSRRLGK